MNIVLTAIGWILGCLMAGFVITILQEIFFGDYLRKQERKEMEAERWRLKSIH